MSESGRILGRFLITTGLVMLVVGVVLLLVPKLGALGRLPGDIRFYRGSTSISIPLATSLLLSVLLTILLNLFARR